MASPHTEALERFREEAESLEKEYRARLEQLRLKAEMELFRSASTQKIEAPAAKMQARVEPALVELPPPPLSPTKQALDVDALEELPPVPQSKVRRAGGRKRSGKGERRNSILLSDDMSIRWESMHALCSDPLITLEALVAYMEKYSASDDAEAGDDDGSCPIHLLVANRALNYVLLSAYLDKFGWTIELPDGAGRSVFAILCSNTSLTLEMLTRVVTCARDFEEDASIGSSSGATLETPLHCLCSNAAVTTELLELLVTCAPSSIAAIDSVGRTPAACLRLNSTALIANTAAQAGAMLALVQPLKSKTARKMRRASIGTPVDL